MTTRNYTDRTNRLLGLSGLAVGSLLVSYGILQVANGPASGRGPILIGALVALGALLRLLVLPQVAASDRPSAWLVAFQTLLLVAFLAFGVGLIAWGVMKRFVRRGWPGGRCPFPRSCVYRRSKRCAVLPQELRT